MEKKAVGEKRRFIYQMEKKNIQMEDWNFEKNQQTGANRRCNPKEKHFPGKILS